MEESLRAGYRDRWVRTMTDLGCYWHHDGNIKRPYALLTGGGVSNFFANCSGVTERPATLHRVVDDLFQIAPMPSQDAWVGSAYGAITLSLKLAERTRSRAWFTTKVPEDKATVKGEMALDRFGFNAHIRTVSMCEDVITTFGTTERSMDAVRQRAEQDGVQVEINKQVFCIVNRTGKREIDGFRIVSLIEVNNAKVWERDQNPFTGGHELVAPVRPKGNWELLTKAY